jgi:hypothetical protein
MNTIKLPPLSPNDHPEPHTMKWSALEMQAIQAYATSAVQVAEVLHAQELQAYELTCQNLRAELAQRGKQMATLHITMERHDNGQSLAKSEPFRFVKASPIWRATEELPLGEYPLYTAPQPERKPHTEAEVQEIIGSALREFGVFEATVRDVLGVPKP